MDSYNIGEKVLKFREQRKISQKEMAERINISSSMVSQIEHNLANPSLNTLKAISKELDIPLYYLFMESQQKDDVVVRKNNRRLIGSTDKKAPFMEMLTPDTSGVIEFLQMTLQPGTSSSEEKMNHDSEEVAYVLKGCFNLFLEDKIYELTEGDSVRIQNLAAHRWSNPGDSESILIFAVTPPNF